MLLDISLLNSQHYKVHFKSKVEQSKERSSTLPIHLSVVAIEKGAFGLPTLLECNLGDYITQMLWKSASKILIFIQDWTTTDVIFWLK